MAQKPVNGSASAVTDDTEPDPGTVDPGTDSEVVYRSSDDAIPTVEPSTIKFDPDPSTEPKRRGRKPGSRNVNTKQSRQGAEDLTGILLSLHMMGAALLKVPELELDQKEAERLGAALNRVNELYGGFILSQKAAAWVNLTFALGHVYGPRMLAYKLRMENEAKKKPVTIDAQRVM